MTKNRSFMGKVRRALLGVGVALAVGLVPSTAQAVTGGSASDLTNGGGNLEGNQVYFGNYNGGNVNGDLKWYVVDSESPDAEGNNAITLWTGETFVYSRQSSDNSNWNNWENSDVKVWLNDTFYPTAFSEVEKSKISLYGISETNFYGEDYSVNQHVVLPSIREMVASVDSQEPGKWEINQTKRAEFGNNWLLRSPTQGGSGAAFVMFSGRVDPTSYAAWGSGPKVRPALKIPLDSILFTSSATSGSGAAKSEVEVGDGLQAVTKVAEDARTTTPLKLTIIDDTVSKPTVRNFTTSGNQVSFDYTDGVTGADQYLSVLITDKNDNDKVVYYGKLAATENAGNGNVSFDTSKIADGDYTIKVFNEKENGDMKTDVASEPAEYDLYKRGELPYVLGSTIAFDGYEWYVIDRAENNALRVLLKSQENKDPDSSVANKRPYVADTIFGGNNEYEGSDLRTQMNAANGMIENDREKELVQVRELAGGSGNCTTNTYDANKIAGGNVNDAKFWPLSVAEANMLNDGIRSYPWFWWLRSPGNNDDFAAYVNYNGYVIPIGFVVNSTDLVVRPAFDMTLDSLLFTSSASEASGKSEASTKGKVISRDVLATGDTQKYTIVDAALKVTVERAEAESASELAFNYKDVAIDDNTRNHYLSAVLVDANDKVQYYSKLTDKLADNASGDATLSLEGIADGTYTVKVYNEQANGDKYTDFASKPTEFKIYVKDGKQSTNSGGIENNEVIGFNGMEWYVIGDGKSGVYPNGDSLTLFLKTGQTGTEIPYEFSTPMHFSASNATYKNSNVENALKAAYDNNITNSKEKGLIAQRTLKVSKAVYEQGSDVYPDTIYSEEIDGNVKAHFWPLSSKEAMSLEANSDIKEFDFNYWLRSPGLNDNYAAYVFYSGYVYPDGDYVSLNLNVVRPAFDLPLDSLLFTSSASGTSGAKDDGKWQSSADLTTDGTKKLTMISKDLQPLGITNPEIVTGSKKPGDTIKISYDNAITGNAKNVVSAVLLDETNEVQYYYSFGQQTNVSGNLELKIPEDFAGGEYKLKVFNEERNGDNFTDFASESKAIDVTFERPKVDSVTPVGDSPKVPIADTELTITFDTAMDPDAEGTVELYDGTNTIEATIVDGSWDNGDKTVKYKVEGSKLLYNTTYNYRISGFKDADGTLMDADNDRFSFSTIEKEATPNITIESYTEETLSSFEANAEYTISYGTGASEKSESITPNATTFKIKEEWFGHEIKIVKNGVNNQPLGDSEPQPLMIDSRPAEPDVTMNPASSTDTSVTDGTITGVDTTMEYRTKVGEEPFSNWAACTGTTIENLANGTEVEVRVAATATAFHGVAAKTTVKALPTIDTVTPSDTETASGTLSITFTKEMKTAGAVLLDGQPLSTTGAQWSADNKTYTIPYVNLEGGRSYTITVKDFVDNDDYTMAEDATKKLQTAAKPTVASTDPGPTKKEDRLANELKITFDKVMDTDVERRGTVDLTTNGSTQPTLTFARWEIEDKTAVYTVSGLAYGGEYTYEISGFYDKAGFIMASDSSYQFDILPQETKPAVTIDYETETLTNFEGGATYTITIDGQEITNSWSGDRDFLLNNKNWLGKEIKLVRNGIAQISVASDCQIFTLPVRNDEPTVTVEPQSKASKVDGKMTVTAPANVSYKKVNEDWKTYTTTLEELKEGTTIAFRSEIVPENSGVGSGKFRSLPVGKTMSCRPSVQTIVPATDAPVSGELAITFDRGMSEVAGAVELSLDGIIWTPLTPTSTPWSENKQTYTVTYSTLLAGQTYKLKVSGFKDATTANLEMKADDGQAFTIAEKPKVVGTDPNFASPKVKVEEPSLTITFDQVMEKSVDGKVTLTGGASDLPITYAATDWSEDGKTLTVKAPNLAYGTTYTYSIDGFISAKGTKLDKDERFNFTTIGKETTDGIELDYVNETLTGLLNDKSYKIDAREFVAIGTTERITDLIGNAEATINVVKKGDNIETVDSEPKPFSLPARAPAPTGYTVEPASNSEAADGMITGLDATLEYRVDRGDGFEPWETSTTITGLKKNDKVEIRVAADNAAERFHGVSSPVTITDRPLVDTVTPLTDAPANGTITITFNKNMQRENLGRPVAGVVKLNGFELSGRWLNERTYEATYTSLIANRTYPLTIEGFTDTQGNVMTPDTGRLIQTAAATTVTDVVPNDTTKVDITTNELRVTFDKALNQAAGTIRLTGGTNTPVTENLHWEGNTAIVSVSGLEYNTTYTYEITGFVDNQGFTMAEDKDRTFVTLAKEDASSVELDYEAEALTDFDTGDRYTINGKDYTADGKPYSIQELIKDDQASSLAIVKLAKVNESVDSDVRNIDLPARSVAPTDLEIKPASDFTKADGELTGVSDTMEYKVNEGKWTPGTGKAITKLAKGDVVQVRTAASNERECFYGLITTVTMTDYPVVTEVIPTETAPRSGELQITFSKAMNDQVAGIVKLGESTLPKGTWNDTKTIYTTTYAELKEGTTYPVIIEEFVDGEGYKLVRDTKHSVQAGDKTSVTAVAPDDAKKVDISTDELRVTFGEAMNTDKDKVGTLTLSGGTKAPKTTFERWDGNTVIYKVSGLEYGTTYTYQISGFTNAKGFVMAEDMKRTFTTFTQESISAVDIDYEAETLTGLIDGAKYTINEEAFTAEGTALSITSRIGNDMTIVKLGDGVDTVDSELKDFKLPSRAKAPTGYTVVPASNATEKDGKITGLNDTLEYKLNGSDWQPVTAKEITGLKKDDAVELRVAASSAHQRFRGESITVTLADRPVVSTVVPMTDVAANGTLTLNFSKEMQREILGKPVAGTVQMNGFELKGAWKDAKTYEVTYSSLTAGQSYPLSIQGFKDSQGVEMAPDTSKVIQTSAKASVVTVSPDATTKVAPTINEVRVTFDKAMNPATGTVTLSGGTKVPTTTLTRWEGNTAIYQVTGLESNTAYTYQIQGFIDAKGFTVAEDMQRTFSTLAQEVTPDITLDYQAETLNGFIVGAKYRINGQDYTAEGTTYSIGEQITITPVAIEIVKLGVDGSVDSESCKLTLPGRPSKPEAQDFTIVPTSHAMATDGEITGVDETMEYSIDGGATWKSCTSDAIKGLGKGIVQVRQAASNDRTCFCGEALLVTITDAPVVLSVIPTTTAPRSGELQITFSKPMANAGTVKLGETILPAGTWNTEQTIYTTTYAELKDQVEYPVIITDFQDQEGGVMAEENRFTVTVGDHEAPTLVKATPSGENVAITTNQLVLSFSEGVQVTTGTVTADGLTLSNPRGSEGNQVVTYDLTGLVRNQSYEVKMAGFTDLAGNAMAATTHTFKTQASTYTIAYDKGAEDATGTMSSQILTYDRDAIKLAKNTFQRVGHHFAGWIDESGQTYTDEQAVANLTAEHEATITLKAQWAANSYQGNFDNNGGVGTIASQPATYGTDFTLPGSGFTREGYRLIGWSTAKTPNESNTYEIGATLPWRFVKDTTFYAVWQAEYTVRFNPDNGEGITEQQVLAGETATAPGNPTKVHHSFGGWLLNGSLYDFNQPVTQDLELVAQWNKIYHTVTFDANGGSGSKAQSVMSGTIVVAPEVIRNNHRLIGWSTNKAGGALWDFKTAITDEVTLYAQWQQNQSYTLTFNTNGGEAMKAVSNFEGTVIDLGNYRPVRKGFIFGGWYSDSGLTQAIQRVTLTNNQTIYAKWQEVEEERFVLSFNSNGGSTLAEKTYAADEVVSLSDFRPTKTGYTFAGWYAAKDLSGAAITTITMSDNQVLYAKWMANSYTVAINVNGGAGSEAPLNATYEAAFTFPSANGYTRDGHQLIGWQIGEERYQAGSTIDSWSYTSNQTITAVWAKNVYTITFANTGDTEVKAQYIEHGDQVIEPSAPSRKDHTFTNWYLTEDASGDPIDFEGYRATNDVTFYAGWQSMIFHTVSFESRDGSKVQSIQVRQGEKAPIPEALAWEGYTFEGWYTAAGEAIDALAVQGPTTFIAKWNPIAYTLTLINPYETDESLREIVIPYDLDVIKDLPEPTVKRPGYNFVGWQIVENRRAQTTEASEIYYDDTEGLSGNLTLEATWVTIPYSVTFDSAGGSNHEALPFTIESDVSKFPTPTREGYLFQGWYNAAGEEVTSIPVGTIGDQPLTARWLADKTKLAALVKEELEQQRSANSYTTNSWRNYEAALVQAQQILVKEDATAQEVYEALVGLQVAIDNLTEKQTTIVFPPVTKPDGDKGSGDKGTSKKPTTSKTTNKKATSKKPGLLPKAGEEDATLCLILGTMLIFFVVPAWKKNQDSMK